MDNRQAFGVVGGLGALAGADFLQHLIRATAADPERYAVAFEQQSFPGDRLRADTSYDPTGRKLHAFSLIRRLEARGIDVILLPCFISQTFLDEIAPNISTPVFGLMDALRAKLAADHPAARRVGVLTSDYVRDRGLFDRAFQGTRAVVYPDAAAQHDLMEAVYAAGGIKAGRATPDLLETLRGVCAGLCAAGCEVIVPGFTELSLVHAALSSAVPVPVLNVNQSYADFALYQPASRPRRAFKIGVVGGVGPLATVDFMGKVVRLTEAARDQDHIKMIVEQNPQIPDRTEHLVRGGTDPTIAMFATCKKLEAAEADLIAIPCNTAHAFVDRIQGHLRIPVLNMLDETMAQVAGRHPGQLVGLLATSGTVESGVYAEAAKRAGVEVIVPDAEHQTLVMEAIYGASGVKAGFTEGQCRYDLRAAIVHLAERGAGVVVLGCTELPLLFPQAADFDADGATIALLDPTMLLAAACVRHAQAARITTISGNA
ncbi:aspartate/glutamate racemase family protein [Methylobacterium planeticum]|uniref:Aspartate/glutamate racemase family protein n=1 Tax=Methylobacterium planeticum TaxID=2615211 RepID=A0A6N6MP37_9HYPH|nr:aspartate/glutamate racemase family protein [Methylobacterium planeticum]